MTFIYEFFEGMAQFTVWERVNICHRFHNWFLLNSRKRFSTLNLSKNFASGPTIEKSRVISAKSVCNFFASLSHKITMLSTSFNATSTEFFRTKSCRLCSLCTGITINIPVVYMAGDVMILMRANPFRGPLEELGPENETFWGSEMVGKVHWKSTICICAKNYPSPVTSPFAKNIPNRKVKKWDTGSSVIGWYDFVSLVWLVVLITHGTGNTMLCLSVQCWNF